MIMKKITATLLLLGSIGFFAFAVRWTYEIVVRPYGWTVWASSSDESYFNWTPADTIPGENRLLILGTDHKVKYRLPSYQPWMDELRDWSYSIFPDDIPTLQQVDSLLVWWHGVFRTYPTYSSVVPDVIPFRETADYVPQSYLNQPTLCGTQAFLFRSILLSRGIISRAGSLHVDARAERPLGHSTIEVWIPELEKWVYVDQMIGVRLELETRPLSIVDVVRLQEISELEQITVFSMNERTPWPGYRFAMRYMSVDDIGDFFRNAGVHFNSSEMLGFVRDEFPRYSIGYSSYSSVFDPSTQDSEAYRYKLASVIGAWITFFGLLLLSVCTVRE